MTVRKFISEDIDAVMHTWLQTNIVAHSFIPPSFWNNNVALVRSLITDADVYICEIDGAVNGFAGVSDGYIAGIFVKEEYQSKGIGKMLIDDLKLHYTELQLRVYVKNSRAVSFYLREGFNEVAKNLDEQTSEIECLMIWKDRDDATKSI